MASSIVLIAPEAEPVTVADAMRALRIDEADAATDLEAKLLDARERAEYLTGRALITQTRRLQLLDWPGPLAELGAAVLLDFPPVQEVAELAYWSEGQWVTVQASALELVQIDKIRWAVVPVSGSWPTLGSKAGHRVRVDFVCGFGPAGDSVPEPIRQWITTVAGHAWSDPTASGDAPNEYIDRRLDGWRVWL